MPALPLLRPDIVAGRIAAHLNGDHALTGLELYYELERSTPLLELHGLLRLGPKNRAASGLQQSYGDHNRLLLLGLDRLLAGDVGWYAGRVWPGEPITTEDLELLMEQVAGLGIDERAQIALWLGAALHDCGMIGQHSAHFDVEDGVVVGADILSALCPPDLVGLARFAVRHHDYIKDIFLGEVPVALVADDLASLPDAQHPLALGVLGLIQVAGSASLGEGRLTRFRMEVFRRCIEGSALDDTDTGVRAARLLRNAVEDTEPPPPAALPPDAVTVDLLERVPLHGWHRAMDGLDVAARRQRLGQIAERWSLDGGHHVFLPTPLGAEVGPGELTVALNGTEVLVLAG